MLKFLSRLFSTEPDRDPYAKPWVSITDMWVNCTAFPSQSNGRAYSGFFYSSSNLLNRIWYAGAWTLQLSTIDPREGSAVFDYNRNVDGNKSPTGSWYSNFTVSNGTAVTTDGAKRDRIVWPGDMYIAVPGIGVSTYDLVAVRNALDVLLDHQYGDGSLPWAGPPLGFRGEFSDTYHLHTLLGVWNYILFSGDFDWLAERWPAYLRALEVSTSKVDAYNLMHVTSGADWLRQGMTGHNLEASAILHAVLGKSIRLAAFVEERLPATQPVAAWAAMRAKLEVGIQGLYCGDTGLFSDNIESRNCHGPDHTDPQDGNSWALISEMISDEAAWNVSRNLRARWTKYGAPAVEFPNVISPFASGFELLGHCAAGEHDRAVELMLLMWGYLLDGPGFTNSTLAEGYRIDGDVQYPAYWSAARNSHCHGWATGPTAVLTSHILGITLSAPAGKGWLFRPVLTKWLAWARGGFATKMGTFEGAISRIVVVDSDGNIKRRGQIAVIDTPAGTSGSFAWKDAGVAIAVDGGEKRSWALWEDQSADGDMHRELEELDAVLVTSSMGNGEDWYKQRVKYHDDLYVVFDESFAPPGVEDRPLGIVDWDALARNYAPPISDMRWGREAMTFEAPGEL